MPHDYLKGCGEKYFIKPLQLPLEAEVLAPFVRCNIFGPGGEITVGNRSSDDGSHAIIKSFQFGTSNGSGVVFEIVDEAGGKFSQFLSQLGTDLVGLDEKHKMRFNFGWIQSSCSTDESDGGYYLKSNDHYMLMEHFSAVMENGLFKYIIEGTDITSKSLGTRAEGEFGTDDNPMPLQEAIKKLFSGHTPAVPSVKFLRVKKGGKGTEPWEFKGNPRFAWKAEQKNPMLTVLEWIRPYVTDKEKGIVPAWNSTSEIPEIIFWEDYKPECNENVDASGRHLGTYIVNGGKKSSVISFKPTFKWPYAGAAAAGGVIDLSKAEGLKQDEDDPCDLGDTKPGSTSHGGVQTENQTPDSALLNHGFTAASKETILADKKHKRAHINNGPITADLVIQGNPEFDDPLNMNQAKLSIVYINPFYIEPGFGNGCKWVAVSNCNAVLSNSGWQVGSIIHDIRQGAYTTTLSLFLAASGSDIKKGANLGATKDGYNFDNPQ